MTTPDYPQSLMRTVIFLVSMFLTWALPSMAHRLPLTNATVMISPAIQEPMRQTAPRVLIEEIQQRTSLTLSVSAVWPRPSTPVIALVLTSDTLLYGRITPPKTSPNAPEYQAEGFRVVSQDHTIWVMGADARGVLFGVGWLLRHLQWSAKNASIDVPIAISSSPIYPIRGHQMGYRNTANSYDAWSVAQYEQYIREMAIFGANAIENIPFHPDSPTPHFKIPAEEMRLKMSEICKKYEMDYWVWTPLTFELTDSTKCQAELQRHEAFYRQCPRLDHVFVPGGDPGHNHPRHVLPFLKNLHQLLTQYHPRAKVWLSLQGFSVEQTDYFYKYLSEVQPKWLQGVVSGPGSPSMAETRHRLPQQYQHRQYPDITHNVRCEFPVRNWDQAYALTLGREAPNPRPYAYAHIHQMSAPFTDGFVSYSDGCHDDINKVLWSMKGWNPSADVAEILTEYTHFFFGQGPSVAAADGVAALENNWRGPLIQNGGVETTFSFWRNLEATYPHLQNNWRWQILLLRADYDTYIRRRLIYEQKLEKQANEQLAKAAQIGTKAAMKLALSMVNQADSVKVAADLSDKIAQRCQRLYQQIGLQTSVPKHQARGYERGAIWDLMDYPLNNRWWLADEFKKIDTLRSEKDQLARLQTIQQWANPPNGSFYDDISNIAQSPHVTSISEDATDIAWWDNGFSRARLSAQTFQKCPQLTYTHLMPNARYVIRIAGTGDALLRVDGQRLEPIRYGRTAEQFKEWIVPLSLSQDGQLNVTFDEPEESHLNWRQHSKISDVWLLKQ